MSQLMLYHHEFIFELISELVPNEASYYGNRAACYMMMKRYQEALSDSQNSLKIDSSYEKVITTISELFCIFIGTAFNQFWK